MAHRISPAAEADLDDIWYFVAKESASVQVAERLIESIGSRFLLLARYPHLGRSRDTEFGPGIRSLVAGDYVILYAVQDDDVLILRVVHGRRDLEALFRR